MCARWWSSKRHQHGVCVDYGRGDLHACTCDTDISLPYASVFLRRITKIFEDRMKTLQLSLKPISVQSADTCLYVCHLSIDSEWRDTRAAEHRNPSWTGFCRLPILQPVHHEWVQPNAHIKCTLLLWGVISMFFSFLTVVFLLTVQATTPTWA